MKRIAPCLALPCLLLQIFLGAHVAGAAEPASPTSAAAPRYTFSWPLDSATPIPRGGTTRGAPVTLDTQESGAWRSLHEAGLSPFEQDRRAILAMAGEYRSTFDFLEIVTFKPGAARDRPYQSWGTERVYVDRDETNFISLVHILEMRLMQPDGSVGEPMVSKHWRQDWRYEPKALLEFQGRGHWTQRDLAHDAGRGRWSQAVYQVDESPRYSSIGRWQHEPGFSTWISAETWRPLPRREFSQRKDYQVLMGTNRVTLTATGWVQEENNLKTVLNEQGRPDADQPYLAREYGVARYERLRDADFAAADRYYGRTRVFWDEVHAAWSDVIHRDGQLALRAPPNIADPFGKLFTYADQIAGGKTPPVPSAQVIREALREQGATAHDPT